MPLQLKETGATDYPYDMAASIAWLLLSSATVNVHVELRRRYNGDLSLSLDELARLLHLMMARGRWYERQATTYAVTDRPMG